MRIAITGSSGLLGTALQRHLRDHEVLRVTRVPGGSLQWDPAVGLLEPSSWEGLDGVIHLAGESIGQRWSKKKATKIMASRRDGTHALCTGLAGLAAPPKWIISASAVGWYGNAGDDDCPEESPRGTGFLADVGAAWEAAADPARTAGIRVVHPRTGIVLADGGALARMLPPFQFGLGGPMGSGKQWFPWIHIEDWCRAVVHLTTAGEGPINLTSPGIVRQRDFAKRLGKALHRPAVIPLPGFIVKLLFGRMGTELLLWGQHATSKKLTNMGFEFQHPDVSRALDDVLSTSE